MAVLSHAETLDSHETGLPGLPGLCFRSITNTPAPFVPPNVWTPENARQFWLSRESSLSYASLPPRKFSMRLSPIRVALKTFSLEEWFWRLVFVGVVCDFLYLGWFIVRSATRTLTLKEGIANF